jgi:predicted dehydrogenase
VRIGFAGLATSHPYTDANILGADAELAVWEPDTERLHRFQRAHPGATVRPTLDSLLDLRLDGVVLTVPTPQVAGALSAILDRDLPCFVNKPAAATAGQLAALEPAVARAPHRVLSSSVLRFAPDLWAYPWSRDDVLAARATVRHDVGLWAGGYNPWQDDPAAGGGTLVSMGLHGVELLVALLGPAVRLVAASTAVRRYRTLASEDTALLALRWDEGIVGSVEVLGVSDTESYEVTLLTPNGEQRVVLRGGPDRDHTLGYRATANAFLDMVRGADSPVPWEQTRAILTVLAEARAATDAGRPTA